MKRSLLWTKGIYLLGANLLIRSKDFLWTQGIFNDYIEYINLFDFIFLKIIQFVNNSDCIEYII